MPKITLKTLAKQIEAEFPDLVATAEPGRGYCDTDRKIPGTRLRHPGKGRRGTLLTVRRRDATVADWVADRGVVFEHNAAETYRTNQEVVDWIVAERKRRAGS